MSNSIRLTEAMPTVDRQGQLWFGMVGGLLTFNPKELKKSQYLPRIIFNSVRYQGEQHTHPILHQQRLEITNSDRRSMTISFAALDYEDNYLMQYAYRLDDNSKWNYIGHNPHIAFSELSPGEHTLTVKSTNCDGIWTDNETQLTIDIQPLLWERSWFQLLLLLVVIMLAATAIIRYQRHRQQVKEREQRMEHILRQYNELQEQLERQAESAGTSTAEPTVTREYKLEEPQVDNPDDKMMDQLMKFIEAHISDEGLKIEDMADAVGLGRTVFYGKVKELVGVSPSDFLRQVRMQRAIQLVVKSKMTFSEIAYSVGFTDPKYFTKCFKKQTGMTPSEYRTSQLSSYVSKAS
jgi:AraC-like DNA-binding protein